MHAQQQILEGITAALAAAGTAAGSRVYLERLDPLERGELPAIRVMESTEGEKVEWETIGALEQRTLSIVIACVVAHSTDFAAQARALGLEVEKVLGAPAFPLPKPGRTHITGSRLALDGDGDTALARPAGDLFA